jgi:uncharacterized membrane protein YheB (UPF0754 family)
MNKSFISHAVAFAFLLAGLLLPNAYLQNIGLFALAGSITNALAIHMLFEKVPGLYGSGVIPNRFEDFKAGIFQLVMQQFFNQDNMTRFFHDPQQKEMVNFDDIIDNLDISRSFDAFTEIIMSSQFGGMLNMFGGAKTLENFREPFLEKLKKEIKMIAHSDTFQLALEDKMQASMQSEQVHEKVSQIVQGRLNELTPKMVKDIVSDMIRQHLGWLVVWGAAFGGLIGLAVELSTELLG